MNKKSVVHNKTWSVGVMYLEASYKPYIIAAMILLSKVKTPADRLSDLLETGRPRIFYHLEAIYAEY